MYVVTADGRKLPVDDSGIDWEEARIPFQDAVGLYTDDTILKDVWILELNKRDYFARDTDFELQFVKEIKYNHKPTKEEILWAMSQYGCTRGSIAFIRKGSELDIDMSED